MATPIMFPSFDRLHFTRLITSVFVFAINFVTSLVCGQNIDCIVVHSASETETIIMLDNAKTMTFENDQIVIGDCRWMLDDILRYEFANSSECGLTDIMAI